MNITQPRQENEKNHQEEDTFSQILDYIPCVVWTSDREGKTIFVSSNVKQVYGYSPEEIYQAGASLWFERIHSEDRKRVKEAYALLFEENQCFDVEYRIQRKNGQWVWIHDQAVLIQEHSQEQYACGIVSDITRRKEVEQALRREKEFSDCLIQHSVDGILAFDREARYTVWNPGMEYITGLPKEDVLGKCAFELFPFLQETGEDAFFYDALDGRTVTTRERPFRVPETGREGFYEGYYAPLRNGNWEITGGLAVIRDITERKLAEEQVRTSERQYRLLVERVAQGIGIIQGRRLVFANETLASILDERREELVGKVPLELFRDSYADQFEMVTRQLDNHVAEPYWEVLEFVVTRDQRQLWLEGRHSVILWEGKPAILVTIRDMTEQKQREQEQQRQQERLRRENLRLRKAMKERYRFGDIIGKSFAMQQVYELIIKAADSEANVLIDGESGTGKDLIAQTIHELSERHAQPFIPVNCGSIQETLFEREFFGHRKGAFTGAIQNTPGYFDAAHEGTLFLDEVGELPLTMQVKLLRAIEGKGYTPVGAQTVKQANVRIIAATNRNLEEYVRQGHVREDFFYRLNVIPVHVPPLRERREDIPLLIDSFLQQYAPSGSPRILPGKILETLYHYEWPGNVRQLQNVLQRYLTLGCLDFGEVGGEPETGGQKERLDQHLEQPEMSLHEALEQFEKHRILRTLRENQWHRAKTAEKLDIDVKTLYRKIKKYQIALPE